MDLKSIVGITMAAGAGVVAFMTEIDNQRKDKKIAEMENRIANLEQKEAE